MNERIIETEQGNVLLYRDRDDEHDEMVIVQSWYEASNTVFFERVDLENEQAAKRFVADYSVTSAISFLRRMNAEQGDE